MLLFYRKSGRYYNYLDLGWPEAQGAPRSNISLWCPCLTSSCICGVHYAEGDGVLSREAHGHRVTCHDCRDRWSPGQGQTGAAKSRNVCQDLPTCQVIILKCRLPSLVSHRSAGSDVVSVSDSCG